MLGRDFRPDDDREGATPVVMLGHDVWRNRYQSNPDVIGRTIRVNGVAVDRHRRHAGGIPLSTALVRLAAARGVSTRTGSPIVARAACGCSAG